MKGEYIAEDKSKNLGENPYSHGQTELLQNNLTPDIATHSKEHPENNRRLRISNGAA
jgi:hypothetical protein